MMKHLFSKNEIEIFPEPLVGIVERKITSNEPGRVKFLGTYWPAKLHQMDSHMTLVPEQSIYIIGIQGITLLVIPVHEELTHKQ